MCTTTSSSVLFCKKPRGTKRPWYRRFEKDTPVLLRAGALSIQQKFWFEISKIPRAQWNGSFRFHIPVTRHRVFAYCSRCKQDTNLERYWGQQFCQMERTFGSDRLKWVDWSKWTTFKGCPKYFGRTAPKWLVPLILISNQNLRIFGLNGKRPRKIGCNKFMMYEMWHQRSCVTVEVERSHWPRDLTPTRTYDLS